MRGTFIVIGGVNRDKCTPQALCLDLVDLARIALLEFMEENTVEHIQGSVRTVTSTGVALVLPDGTRAELPADTVIVAFGLRPDLSSIEPLLNVVSESYFVGDCNSVGSIFNANHDAFNVAVEV